MPGLAAIHDGVPFTVRCAHTLEDAVTDLDWSGDGQTMFVGTAAGRLHRYRHDGRTLGSWQGHRGGVTRLCTQPGGDGVLASAGEDGQVMLWKSDSGEATATLATENAWVEHLAWTPDGGMLAAAARKTISVWQGTESLGVWYDARREVLAMAWAPDGRRLATAANKGLYLWRMAPGQTTAAEPMQLLTFPGAPVALAWQPNGKALAVGTQDGFLQVWRPAGGKAGAGRGNASQLTMRGYPGKVNCLAWHPRRPLIATAGGPDVVLWQMPQHGEGTRGRPLRHHRSTITALAWSADGGLLASGDRAGRLCIWDAEGQAIFSRTLGHEISVISWQPDHPVLTVGDTGGGLHLFDHPHPNNDSPIRSPDRETHSEQR